MINDITKIFVPAMIAFLVGILIAIPLSSFLYKKKLWKKNAKSIAIDGGGTPVFTKLHADGEMAVPRMGGIVIWLSAILTILGIYVLDKLTSWPFLDKLDFLSRGQTWIPLVALMVGSAVGLMDDMIEINGGHKSYRAGGLSLKKRLLVVALVSLGASLWFYLKLDVSSISIPYVGAVLNLGFLFVPFFVIVALAVYSGGIIDGIDGLAGGIFAAIFSAYVGVAFHQNQVNLAAFCAVIVGATLAFLWFNIPPARFYMSETGSMALTLSLTMVAFMTDQLGDGYGITVLLIAGLPLFVTSLSVIVQLASKRLRGKKVFISSPLHHHFEAIGWPSYKVTMRYWVIAIVLCLVAMIVAFTA